MSLSRYLWNNHLKFNLIILTYTEECKQSFVGFILQFLTNCFFSLSSTFWPAVIKFSTPQNFLVSNKLISIPEIHWQKHKIIWAPNNSLQHVNTRQKQNAPHISFSRVPVEKLWCIHIMRQFAAIKRNHPYITILYIFLSKKKKKRRENTEFYNF